MDWKLSISEKVREDAFLYLQANSPPDRLWYQKFHQKKSDLLKSLHWVKIYRESGSHKKYLLDKLCCQVGNMRNDKPPK